MKFLTQAYFLAFFWILCSAVYAEDEVKTVLVDIEMPIQVGDLAGAKNAAEKRAFESAVEQTNPATMDAKLKAARIRGASQFVKTFRVEREREEGGTLKMKFRVEVLVPIPASKKTARSAGAESPNSITSSPTQPKTTDSNSTLAGQSPTGVPTESAPSAAVPEAAAPNPSPPSGPLSTFFYEATWKPQEVALNPMEFFKALEAQTGMKAASIRINRGAISFSLDAPTTQDAQAAIVRVLDPKVQLREVRDPSLGLVMPSTEPAPTTPPLPSEGAPMGAPEMAPMEPLAPLPPDPSAPMPPPPFEPMIQERP